MRSEVGRDGKTVNERLKEKSSKVQGILPAEGVLRVGGPLGKIDVHVGGRRVLGQ